MQSKELSGCQIFHAADLPQNWDCVPLRERVEFLYGRALHEEDRCPGEIDVFGSNGKVGTHNTKWLDGPGILVGRKGTVGAVHYAMRSFWPIDTVYYVTPINGDHLRYLYHLLQYLPLSFLNAATGVPGLSRRDVYALRGAFPPPEEQAAIVRVLDSVDKVIELTREVVESTRQLRRSLLANLLSRGIDRDGRVRNLEKSPGEFVKTPLGRLPYNWELSTVEKEFDLQNGFTLNEARRPRNRKRRYLRVANVQRDSLDLRDIQELEARDAEFLPRMLETDDLLVVEGHADRMQIGRCAMVTEEAKGMTFQNHLFRLRAGGKVIPYFGCLWLNSVYAQKYWNERCATTSGLNTINQRMLKRLIIPAPSQSEQEAIVSVVAAQRAHLETLSLLHDRFVSLKRALMHDLLTGKVRVNSLNLAAVAGL